MRQVSMTALRTVLNCWGRLFDVSVFLALRPIAKSDAALQGWRWIHRMACQILYRDIDAAWDRFMEPERLA